MLVLLERGNAVEARRVGPLYRILARVRSHRLDRELASGTSPDRSVLHSLRATMLLHPRHRRRLSRGLRLRAQSVGGPVEPAGVHGVSRSALARRVVAESEAEVLTLASALLASAPVSPRGVAMAHLLVTDSSGPLHRGCDAWELRLACRAATEILEDCSA